MILGWGSLEAKILNVGLNMTTNVGLDVTTDVGFDMTANVGLNTTTNVGPNMTTNVGRGTSRICCISRIMFFPNSQVPPNL